MENLNDLINKRFDDQEKIIAQLLDETYKLKILVERVLAKPMNMAEAAEYLRRPKSFLYKAVAKKEIPHIFIRRRLYFNKIELTAWMKSVDESNNVLNGK